MDFSLFLLGVVSTVFTLILALITLFGRIRRALKATVRDVLVEEGLIRPMRPGDPSSWRWPNGWHNLPDTLDGIWKKEAELEKEIRPIVPSS